MRVPWILMIIFSGLLLIVLSEAKQRDPYKILGVDRSASQREIQKAFHKLSLQYHPDKNNDKGSRAKFEEINNSYEILSDEQKRKNYDLYGDEKGSPGFDPSGAGDHGGYTYFSSGGPGESGFNFQPGSWENTGGQGGSKSFSFSFGSSGGRNPFGFGLDDIFSNFFGGSGGRGNQFGGFGRSQHRNEGSSMSIPSVNSKFYRKDIIDKGMTWLLLFYSHNLQGRQYYESILQEVSIPLQGALKIGSINCETESSFCKMLGVNLRKVPKVFVYSYAYSDSGSLVEFNGDLDAKSLKSFCQDNLPRFSKSINLNQLSVVAESESLPKVMLLSTKKNTPVIWRVLSGLYHKHFLFYNTEVRDITDSALGALDVESLPAIIGWLSNGDQLILKSGISVKDLKSAVQELSVLLENFKKENKKIRSTKHNDAESSERRLPLLTGSNFNGLCGGKTPVCLIGAFWSSKTRATLQTILHSVSRKSFARRPRTNSGSWDLISYALLDASEHQSFLNAFGKSGFKRLEMILVVYKPKRGTFATFEGEITEEAVENFVSSVLNGDVQFTKTKQKPTFR